MKKNNVIIFALLAVISVFLLWLWYYLRFNLIDDPLDLVLSIVWWVVIAAAIGVIIKMEQTRRRRIRTVYVGEGATFNSEKGLMRFEGGRPMQDTLASILENLKYDFTREDFPEEEEFKVDYFVRTKEFKVEEATETDAQAASAGATQASAQTAPMATAQTGEQRTWKGEVVIVDTQEERSFDTPEELASILASLEQRAA